MTTSPHAPGLDRRCGPAIETHELTRHFTAKKKTVEAVRGLDLEVGRGELVAFLGPNGAGKSTTLRMLTTLIAPTSGVAQVQGYDVVREQRGVRRSIGYIGQGNGAGLQQRGRDELVSQGRAYGLNRVDAGARADQLIVELDLSEVADRVVSTLSGGQRRRLDIALGLVHEPGLLFLDEPSTGLDPQNRANLCEQIRRLHAERGTTIVLTTHYLEEADALAERVIVIDHGEVIADDTAARLKSSLGDLVTMTFSDETDAGRAAARLRCALGSGAVGDGAAATVDLDAASIRVRAARAAEQAPTWIADLVEAGLPVRRIGVAGPTLDDVFLDLTGRSLRESPHPPSEETHPETTSNGVAA